MNYAGDEVSVLPEFGVGSCINCGFLSWSRGLAIREAQEVPMDRRVGQWRVVGNVYCFLRVFDLPAEIEQLNEEDLERLHKVVKKSRGCRSWYPWAQGFGPSWHYQERQASLLEDRRREFERGLEAERREFDESLNTINQTFLAGLDQQRRKWEKQSSKWPNRLVVAAVVLACAEVIGIVFGPTIQRLLGLD
jgi:hypothetical protein